MSGIESQKPDTTLRLLVCRVGQAPVVQHIGPDDGDLVDAMEVIVGGRVSVTFLGDGVELYYNDVALARRRPLNRVIPMAAVSLPRAFGNISHLVLPGRPNC